MTALAAIKKELVGIGYRAEALVPDYKFADVLSEGGNLRCVNLAAFTHTPESYRSAAFGVVVSKGDAEKEVFAHRALGAPLFFSIDATDVGLWQVRGHVRPELLKRVGLDSLPDLFRRYAKDWSPASVHRAKSLGQTHEEYQLDFVDIGLLPAIEREVHSKLDRLLEEVIGLLIPIADVKREEAAFRTTFRLLAAKVLQDREHQIADSWDKSDVASVLAVIEERYRLPQVPCDQVQLPLDNLSNAWSLLAQAINFRNISSDNLAFVYENTLVTKDSRKRFGTHSTPTQVAEYILNRIDLNRFDLESLKIQEPFAGAGVFLVSALRHLRDRIPADWSDEKRHEFMTARIGGAEIDAFASEVAMLSLILADYPNANGWEISNVDLFEQDKLSSQIADVNIVLCNPPFENFDAEEREIYPEMFARSVKKPMAVLHTILDHHPDAIGFVLPQGFLLQKQYAKLRVMIASLYSEIELVSLPDRTFTNAKFESALLIATGLRRSSEEPTSLVSTVVDDSGRKDFLETGKISAQRSRRKYVNDDALWVGCLDDVFEYLDRNPHLGEIADIHRGLQWKSQRHGVSRESREGFRRGLYKPASSLRPFIVHGITYLDFDPDKAYAASPLSRPWNQPKVFANNQRLSRGPWRFSAVYDESGLAASQQFFGIWPTSAYLSGVAIEAILNGPLANAFLAEKESGRHFTNARLKELPLPKKLDSEIIGILVEQYRSALGKLGMQEQVDDETLNNMLIAIDAEVLRAYDLPPRLERKLLEYFRGHKRLVSHEFTEWMPESFTACIPLHEYISGDHRKNAGPWVLETFTPAPDEEAAALAAVLE